MLMALIISSAVSFFISLIVTLRKGDVLLNEALGTRDLNNIKLA
jgi:hypothetical protein